MLFNVQVVAIIANALLETCIDRTFVPPASQHEFLAAYIATYRYLYARLFHRYLLNRYISSIIDESATV